MKHLDKALRKLDLTMKVCIFGYSTLLLHHFYYKKKIANNINE